MEETFTREEETQGNTMPSNSALRAQARKNLNNCWLYGVLTALVYYIVGCAAGSVPLAGLLLTLPLGFGFQLTFLKLRRNELDIEEMVVSMFDVLHKYERYLGASLLTALYIILWTLLLIVPGIIMGYAYAMTPYIVHDHPELSADECIDYSRQMMRGNKWKLFCLDLSFIGWALLCLLTLGIGFLWLTPYVQSAHAEFYERLKAINEK